MQKFLVAIAAAGLLGTVAHAQDEFTGDIAAGEKAFSQCQTCHVVVNDAGETLAGRNAKTGPNLYGVFGREAGSVEGFRYSDDMIAAGEKGLVWDVEHFVPYVEDPTGFLREYLDDPKARGKMAFKVRGDETARDLAAYLHSLAPDANSGS
ncbi:Cytochrome c2 [Oceaniovalibus guishaninsula JLT2003]|uniref:Cytochrome c2 n=1 Tax=Oceaniovalibus guishaninsula JLT2003 TaxID=1231392 RepID=K2GM05_9RHOB|nr:c-type cytochrome [Oceaniovalibus guishaninsula]EKE43756.1 Cytochrome c2 [Oceaniovalibus guishaninsula JLT2003]